jgi:hypothetical protein
LLLLPLLLLPPLLPLLLLPLLLLPPLLLPLLNHCIVTSQWSTVLRLPLLPLLLARLLLPPLQLQLPPKDAFKLQYSLRHCCCLCCCCCRCRFIASGAHPIHWVPRPCVAARLWNPRLNHIRYN